MIFSKKNFTCNNHAYHFLVLSGMNSFIKTLFKRTSISTFLLISFLFLFYGCGSENHAGATTETTNGLALFIKDSNQNPLPLARISLFDSNLSKSFATTSDSNGFVYFDLSDSLKEYFVEAIYGNDSSAMAWQKCEGDSSSIQVLPAVEIKVNFNTQDSLLLPDFISLKTTPYKGFLDDKDFVIKKVPQGFFEIVTDDEISLGYYDIYENQALAFSDSILKKSFLLEDFDDGNIQFKYRDPFSAIGWYFNYSDDAVWYANQNIEWTTATEEYTHPAEFITENAYEGTSISLHYSVGDSGMLVFGTHLSPDSINYDFSEMKSIRMMIRGDAIFDIALESNTTVGDNLYPKTLWHDTASTEWTEYTFYPGEEVLFPEYYQYAWDEVKQKIGIFSFFIYGGSFIEIDNIIIDGINEKTFENAIVTSSQE